MSDDFNKEWRAKAEVDYLPQLVVLPNDENHEVVKQCYPFFPC